jgi:plastocyanin
VSTRRPVAARLPSRRLSAPVRAGAFVAASLVALAALAGCSSPKRSTVVTTTTATPQGSTPVNIFALPAPTVPAGGCPGVQQKTATVVVTDTGFTPRCLTIRADQTLRFSNQGNAFHNVQVADLNANLESGGSLDYDHIGDYLEPGAYLIHSLTENNLAAYPRFASTLLVQH